MDRRSQDHFIKLFRSRILGDGGGLSVHKRVEVTFKRMDTEGFGDFLSLSRKENEYGK